MTKKLKLGIAILATIASMNVNAQKKAIVKTTKLKTEAKIAQTATESKTTKPTKQETMDWIGGKMKENLLGNRKFVSYNNGVFISSTTNYGITITLSIDLNKVIGFNNQYSKDFVVTGIKLYSVEQSNDKGSLQYGQNLFISGPNYEDRDVAFNFTPDQALVERLKVAFANLIEYNSSKKSDGESY